MAASNGGYSAQLGLALYPVCTQANNVGAFYFYDITNFNDPNSPSYYNYKVEDVICGRTATIRREIISYRDLGVATLTVELSGTNDLGQYINALTTITIGNPSPLGIILTQIVNLTFTGQNLQVMLVRAANGGPVSITKIRLEGTVETTKY
jgi:hypothetical protein